MRGIPYIRRPFDSAKVDNPKYPYALHEKEFEVASIPIIT